MSNIASYQEGYTDGYDRGSKNEKRVILTIFKEFYNDNYENGAEDQFLRGYNLALDHMLEHIKDIEDMED